MKLYGFVSKKVQAENRKKIQVRAKAERDVQHKKLHDYNKKYPCTFCREFVGNYDMLKYNCDELYGFTIKEDTVYCPKCKNLLVQWE